MATVCIVPCDHYELSVCKKAISEALLPLGGLSMVKPGMRVAIKANLVAGLAPEKAATTHPVLLQALCALLLERGASVVIGDSPGGLYQAAYVEAIYRAAGLTGLERDGVSLNRDFSQATAQFPDAMAAKTFQYTRYLDDADLIINFCKLKSHGMMGMSACAKNLFGVIPGTMKPEYHFRFPDPRDFARMLVDLNLYFHPCLHLVDAVVGMEGNGPTAGTPKKIGALLAGRSAHETDLACAALIGLQRQQVPTLQAAYERHLIPDSAAQLQLAGDLQALRPERFQTVPAHSHLFTGRLPAPLGALQSRLLRALLAAKPAVDCRACIGCRKCETICPAHAIQMQKARPVIDRSRCIRCFCCQEFCPKGAMRVHRTALARLLNRDSR